jgi:hypothetical protein
MSFDDFLRKDRPDKTLRRTVAVVGPEQAHSAKLIHGMG